MHNIIFNFKKKQTNKCKGFLPFGMEFQFLFLVKASLGPHHHHHHYQWQLQIPGFFGPSSAVTLNPWLSASVKIINPHVRYLSGNFLQWTNCLLKARRAWTCVLQMLKDHRCQPRLLCSAKLPITIHGENKKICDETKFLTNIYLEIQTFRRY